MVWDYDTETTNAMMDSVGVAMLPSEETPKDEIADEAEAGLKPVLLLHSAPSSLSVQTVSV